MSFSKIFDPARVKEEVVRAMGASDGAVLSALNSRGLDFQGFLTLLSPAASARLEEMAVRAQRVTRERFGRVVRFFAPVYLSNVCKNSCRYCGFNAKNKVHRATLTPEQLLAEAEILHAEGFRELLLVTGESPETMPPERIAGAASLISPLFPSVSVEVYPMPVSDYEKLAAGGVEGVTVFQESYDPQIYKEMHPAGKKADYGWRLDTPDRVGEARMRKIGLGALLGLGPWRFEAASLALHALYLEKSYWRTQLSISFPRIRHAAGMFEPPFPVSDREMVQMMLALRLFLPDAGLTLSTREAPAFRDGLIPICVTSVSAGSKTEPGGYAKPGEAEEQFEVSDKRSLAEVAKFIEGKGLEPVFKDFDRAFYDSEDGRAASYGT